MLKSYAECLDFRVKNDRKSPQNRVTLAVTGASGSHYAEHVLRALLFNKIRTYLVWTDSGNAVTKTEAPHSLLAACMEAKETADLFRNENVAEMAQKSGLNESHLFELKTFKNDDLFSPLASGSAGSTHMIICPCSMGTMARVAQGMSQNLIERTADVMMKEKRKLIIVPRETPLSLIHLRNMTSLAEAGAHIVPAMPGFYHQPKNLEDVYTFMAERVISALGIECEFPHKPVKWNARML